MATMTTGRRFQTNRAMATSMTAAMVAMSLMAWCRPVSFAWTSRVLVPAFTQEIGQPAGGGVLGSKCQQDDDNRNADERAGQSPQESPEKNRRDHDRRRYGKDIPRNPRLD